jgi:hypothetical protein
MGEARGIIGSTSTYIGLCGLHKDRVTFLLCVCLYVCMYVCMHVRTYVCMYVCMYVCVYVCMYLMYVCT